MAKVEVLQTKSFCQEESRQKSLPATNAFARKCRGNRVVLSSSLWD